MKNILVPIDFSNHSEKALKTAASIAKKHDVKITVAHMLELSESLFNASTSENNEQMLFMLALANKRMKEFINKDYLDGIKLTAVIKRNKVFKELNNLSKEEGADLIVMGSKGHSLNEGVFTGSNTQKVIRFSEVPVLTVKNDVTIDDLNSVVLFTNFSKETKSTFVSALTFFKNLDIKTSTIFINLPGSNFKSTVEIKEAASNFYENLSSLSESEKHYEIISDYTVEEGVLHFASEKDKSAIAVITHGRVGLNNFIKGSISEDIANHAKRPVFTFKI